MRNSLVLISFHYDLEKVSNQAITAHRDIHIYVQNLFRAFVGIGHINLKFIMTKSKIVAFVAAFVVLATTASASAAYMFNMNLGFGMRNSDVRELQLRLNQEVGTTLPGTTYFGSLTKSAVQSYQTMKGITPVSGYVGPLTRAALNGSSSSGNLPAGCTSSSGFSPVTGAPCNSGSGSGSLPAGCTSASGFSPITGAPCNGSGSGSSQSGAVTVSLANTNPASGVLVETQATADLMHLGFTGSGTVTNVELMRTGISTDSTLTNVYLYEGNTRLTDAASVSTGGIIRFNSPSGLFMVNGSRTISVRADIASSTSGQTVGVKLNSYTVSGGTAAMTSISGNMMSIASSTGNIATVSLGGANSVGSPSVDAGTSNYTVWGNTINPSRAAWLKAATFKVIGSAQADALSNVRLIVDGAQVGASSSVDSMSNVVFDLSSSPFALSAGTHTVEVRADVVGGANRSFYVSLQNAGDMMITDSQLGVNVTLGSHIPANYNSGTISIGQGTLSLTKDSTFNATTNVTSGASNVTIAKYNLKAYGEAVKVMQVLVDIDPVADDGLKNIGIFLNGAQVGSSQNCAAGANCNSLDLTYNLGSSLIVAAGQTATIEVRADILDATNAAYTGDITTSLSIPASQAQGMSSYALTSAGSPGTFTVTAAAATATLAKNAGLTNQNVPGNTSNVRVGSFVVQAGTTEGLRVTNLLVQFDTDGGNEIETTDIANLTVSLDGGTTKMSPVNPQSSNNFSVDFTVAPGATKVIDVYADITAASDNETIETVLTITARGASSNTSVTAGVGPITAQKMTIGTGTISSVSVVTSTATSAQYIVGGTSALPMLRYNFKTTGGPATITEFTFDLTGTDAGAITMLSVSGTNGGTTCTAPVIGTTVTMTGCTVPIAQGLGGTDVIVTPTYGAVGYNGIASTATNSDAVVDLTIIKYSNGTSTVTSNLDGTAAPDLSNTAASASMYLVASMPTFTLTGTNSVLQDGEVKVGSLTVSAGNGGNINLNALPIRVAVSGGGLVNGLTADHVNVIVLKEGNTTITTTDNITTDAASHNVVVTFSNDEIITAGSSRTFDIYVYFKTITGGDDSAQVSLSPASDLNWDDVNGGGTSLAGTLLLNFPTNSVVSND